MAAKPEKAGSVDKITVTLRLHHTHAGEHKKPGDTIDVTPAQQQWLAARGIIELQETH